MSEFLTDDWVTDLVGTGSAPGPSATVQVVVGGTPAGDVKFHLAIVDGVVTAATPGNNSKADVALTVPHAEAQAMLAGDLDPNVAFMRGRMKTAGDPGLLLDLLSATAGYAQWRAGVLAATDA
ncbi:MAG: SCP2 sterol-binding domain-containing protein [Acidimicrobiia bacterium]